MNENLGIKLRLNENSVLMTENSRSRLHNNIANRIDISLPDSTLFRNIKIESNTESTNTIPDTKNFNDILNQSLPNQYGFLKNHYEGSSNQKENNFHNEDIIRNLNDHFESINNNDMFNIDYPTIGYNHSYTQRVNQNYLNYLQLTPDTIKKREYNYSEDEEIDQKKPSKDKEKNVRILMDENMIIKYQKVNKILEFEAEDEIKDLKLPFDFKHSFQNYKSLIRSEDLKKSILPLTEEIEELWDFLILDKSKI